MTGGAATLVAMALGVSAAALPLAIDVSPRFIWNASASVPIGLYAVKPASQLQLNDLVVVRPPEDVAAFLAEGGYLPRGVPILKHILALAGQTVCRFGSAVSVDAMAVGDARERDSHGRALPVWQGCRVLAKGEVFLMNRSAELVRWSVFRTSAGRLDRRSRRASLDRPGGMTMQSAREVRALPLFAPETNRSSFPVETIAAAAGVGGVKRAPSQRVANAFEARPRATACLRSLGKIVCLTAMLVSSTLLPDSIAHAENDVTGRETNDGPCDRSLCRLHRRGVAALRCADPLDTRGDARRERRRRSSPIAEGRHGPDADHARDLRHIARPLRSRREPL